MYAAEWPCCHDPLRFSPGSEDLLRFARNNPPLQPPARSSSQTQPCVVVAPELQATHHHLPGAPKQRGSLRLLPCALRRGVHAPPEHPSFVKRRDQCAWHCTDPTSSSPSFHSLKVSPIPPTTHALPWHTHSLTHSPTHPTNSTQLSTASVWIAATHILPV